VKIALSVDALAPSLTGIGRYTWELVKGLQQHSAVDGLGFYRHGRAVADPAVYLAASGKAPSYWPGQKWWQRRCYRQLVGSSFCHGTNYFLPPEAETGVITVHDLSVFKYPETHPIERIREFEKLLPDSVERASHIITDSVAVRQEVIDFFRINPEKITAVALGADPRYRPATPHQAWPLLQQLGLQPGRYNLCVSTLEPRKRIDNLLHSYQLLTPAERQAYPLVLAGTNGWLNSGLLKQVDQAQQQGWLYRTGFVSDAQLVELYQGACLFIYPSVYEGFGLPVLEAMACGIPVITAQTACLLEVAGDAGVVAADAEPAALAQTMRELLADPQRRQALAVAGSQRAAQYSWAGCIGLTLRVYAKAGGAA
jgi:alpha-1,3-rhamnosyl/mannosyltransferase